jgi:hypothetical protein
VYPTRATSTADARGAVTASISIHAARSMPAVTGLERVREPHCIQATERLHAVAAAPLDGCPGEVDQEPFRSGGQAWWRRAIEHAQARVAMIRIEDHIEVGDRTLRNQAFDGGGTIEAARLVAFERDVRGAEAAQAHAVAFDDHDQALKTVECRERAGARDARDAHAPQVFACGGRVRTARNLECDAAAVAPRLCRARRCAQ